MQKIRCDCGRIMYLDPERMQCPSCGRPLSIAKGTFEDFPLNKKTICILGSTGMLGSAIVDHFLKKQNEYNVIFSYRDKPLVKGNSFQFNAYDSNISIPPCDYIINCIGLIKQLNASTIDLWKINANFPLALAEYAHKNDIKLIHISTDCVFDGSGEWYYETDVPKPNDIYGLTKLYGEPKTCMVLRTSIIGEERRGKLSLIEWAKANKGKEILGYTEHYWNGLTAKEFARCIEQIIKEDLYTVGIRHIFSTPVTKYDLLTLINYRFNLNMTIIPHKTNTLSRILATRYDLKSKLKPKNIYDMINEL